MEFYSDIKLLYKEFSKFSETNLIGVGPDLSPHYRLNLEQYRRWFPESTLGDPGWSQVIVLFDLRFLTNHPECEKLIYDYQGFNTGVVLYNLQRMRESETWNRSVKKLDH